MYADVMVSAASLAPIKIEDEEIILIIRKLDTPTYLDHIEEVYVFYPYLDVDYEY